MKIIDVVIETPKGSAYKYDYDPKSQFFKLAKILPGGMVFPYDFGFIPNTMGGDEDPLDVLVLSEFQSFPGCLMGCRIIGCILAEQTEKDKTIIRNDRFMAVPEVSIIYKDIFNAKELPKTLLENLQQFFINYNNIAGKVFKPIKILNSTSAMKLIDKNRQHQSA